MREKPIRLPMLLTVEEAAEKMRISLSKMYAILSRGDLPYYQIDACKRVSVEDVDAYLDEHRVENIRLPPSVTTHFR